MALLRRRIASRRRPLIISPGRRRLITGLRGGDRAPIGFSSHATQGGPQQTADGRALPRIAGTGGDSQSRTPGGSQTRTSKHVGVLLRQIGARTASQKTHEYHPQQEMGCLHLSQNELQFSHNPILP